MTDHDCTLEWQSSGLGIKPPCLLCPLSPTMVHGSIPWHGNTVAKHFHLPSFRIDSYDQLNISGARICSDESASLP